MQNWLNERAIITSKSSLTNHATALYMSDIISCPLVNKNKNRKRKRNRIFSIGFRRQYRRHRPYHSQKKRKTRNPNFRCLCYC